MDLKGKNLGVAVLDIARRRIERRYLGRVNWIAHEIAIVNVAVEPGVGRLIILFVDKGPFDLEIGIVILRQILTGGRPVPVDLGRIFDGGCRNVTGLASDTGHVQIDPFIRMEVGRVTIGAGHLFLGRDLIIIGQQASLDLVGRRLVTVGAEEIVLAHVNIQVGRREVETLIQVTMFDAIAAAAVEVTFATVVTRGGTDTLRGSQ